MNRKIIGPSAAVVFAGAVALLAPSAQAIDVSATGCAFVDYRIPSGSTVTFTLAPGCILGTTDIRRGSPTVNPTSATGPATVIVTINDSYDWAHLYFGGFGPLVETFVSGCVGTNYVYEGSGYTLVDYCPQAPLPPDVLQQVGPGIDGTCEAVDADGLNIGGAGAGGWGKSWAQWANDGRGGPVCTRTHTYSRNSGNYVVAP